MRRLASLVAPVLAALAVLVVLAGVLAPPAQAQTRADRYADQAVTATNASRAAHGLRTLRSTRCLEKAANRQARRMAQREHMYHQDIGAVLRRCGLRSVGENVAYGFPSGRSVVVDGWLNSPGHRANILNPAFRLVAVGARRGHDGRWYVSQVFGRRA